MLGKVKIAKTEAHKFAAACELEDVLIKESKDAGNNMVFALTFKTAGNLIEVGRYMQTLPADAKPTPPKVKATPADATPETKKK